MISAMVKWVREILTFFILAITTSNSKAIESEKEWLSWRLAVETNNLRGWRTVPLDCLGYIESYMMGGQYEKDVKYTVEQIKSYAADVVVSGDGMDAWILDVDDTCLSNILYYKGKKYGYVVIPINFISSILNYVLTGLISTTHLLLK